MRSTPPIASRYLPAETVQVLHPPGPVTCLIPQDRETLMVRWSPAAGWTCTCPAVTSGCGHVAAARKVVVLTAEPATA